MNKKILMAEDSASVRQVMGMALCEAGYDVVEARDGSEALEKMQQERFSMLITDLNMPGADGIEVIKGFRRQDRFSPVLMLTGESEEKRCQEGKQAGASVWLKKPFRADNLLNLVRMVLV